MPKRTPTKSGLVPQPPCADFRFNPNVVVLDCGREFRSRELQAHFHRLGLNIVYRIPTRSTSKKET